MNLYNKPAMSKMHCKKLNIQLCTRAPYNLCKRTVQVPLTVQHCLYAVRCIYAVYQCLIAECKLKFSQSENTKFCIGEEQIDRQIDRQINTSTEKKTKRFCCSTNAHAFIVFKKIILLFPGGGKGILFSEHFWKIYQTVL